MTIVVDGRRIEAEDGELLLDVLARAGAEVPTLCHEDGLEPFGGCRVCSVALEGAPRPVPACATRVHDGMVVSTNGTTQRLRETVQSMIDEDRARPQAREDRNTLIGFDADKCVYCERCIRYARDVAGCSALALLGRGIDAHVSTTAGRSFLDTECELCGGCVAVCPTGALYPKKAAGVPEQRLRQVRTTCAYCGIGCQIDLNVDLDSGRIVAATSKREYLPNRGDLCVKGRFAFDFVHSPDRLTAPHVRGGDGELHPASWPVAIDAAARGLRGVKDRHGAQAVGVISSARLTMEENFLIQKLARTGVGTNSVHSCEAT
jgi:predicted molibdopterin-dependent oxidoreductase YjgC